MKQFFPFLLLLCFSNSFAQFAIVNDKDNFVNVRMDGSTSVKPIDKLQNGHLIYCFENKENWTNIDYEKKGKPLNGYVYKDRYILISDFPAFTISHNTDSTINLKNDSVEITISQSKFDSNKHKFTYIKDYPTQIKLIDNKKYWGMDGEMPYTQFEKISIITKDKNITLPKAALQGLYQPTLSSAAVNYDKETDTYYIQTSNSDGAGSYLVIWKIEKGNYKERFVAYGF